VIHSRKPPALLNRFATVKNISRFDCKHFATAETLTQCQTAARLCKNCGAK
jgi:hypothetical protein